MLIRLLAALRYLLRRGETVDKVGSSIGRSPCRNTEAWWGGTGRNVMACGQIRVSVKSLGIGNGSIQGHTDYTHSLIKLVRTTQTVGLWKMERRRVDHLLRNAEMGGIKQDAPGQITQHSQWEGHWVTRGELFYKEKAELPYKNRLCITIKKNKL